MDRACAGPKAEARFRPHEHLRRRVDFQKVYERGSKVHGRLVTFFALRNGLAYSRLGVAATRKFGGAVVRNRAKRLIREVFRRHKPAQPHDVVVVAKRDLIDATLTSLEVEYRRHLHRSCCDTRL